MSTSFHLPYRGLPIEIRLHIWSYAVPRRTTILRKSCVAHKDEDLNGCCLQFSSPLQIQLLRLNKEVYFEVLSALKKVTIPLWFGMRFDLILPHLARAMRAPAAFTALDYLWDSEISVTRWESFLPKLLTSELPGALKSLNISMPRFEASGHIKISEVWPIGWEVRDLVALAVFAAALLQQGKIEVISITIREIQSIDIHLWSEESLRECLPGRPNHLVDDYPHDSQAFRQFIRQHAGANKSSDIKITVEFKANESGIYSGKVKFTKVLNASKKACLDS